MNEELALGILLIGALLIWLVLEVCNQEDK